MKEPSCPKTSSLGQLETQICTEVWDTAGSYHKDPHCVGCWADISHLIVPILLSPCVGRCCIYTYTQDEGGNLWDCVAQQGASLQSGLPAQPWWTHTPAGHSRSGHHSQSEWTQDEWKPVDELVHITPTNKTSCLPTETLFLICNKLSLNLT